jgi:predicted RNA-binding Zn ribbon-like protein
MEQASTFRTGSTALASRPITLLVGGHPALDLVNTVSWRLDDARRRDNLTHPAALIAWCQRAGLLDEPTATALSTFAAADEPDAQRALHGVLALREQLTHVLEALLARRDDGDVLIPSRLHNALVDALAHSQLTGPPMHWQLPVRQPSNLPHLLALSVLDLLQSSDLHLLGRCAGPGCGWLFLDRTRSHTRRWCNSADCGNRDRARRHYARHRHRAVETDAADTGSR